MKRFLTARWEDLIMANYAVDPALLTDRVPAGTELDLFDGKCFVSLVAFMFRDTRVLGMPVPLHVNFEEVNLRFYVVRKEGEELRRGVCFIKEIVPRHAIATIARVLYGEPYECWSMDHERTPSRIGYSWTRGGSEHSIAVDIGASKGVPDAGSQGEFIIEHYWGYTKRGGGRVDEYKVEHPKWELLEVKDSSINVDMEPLYGVEFAELTNAIPDSIFVAKGSEIAVYKGKSITE